MRLTAAANARAAVDQRAPSEQQWRPWCASSDTMHTGCLLPTTSRAALALVSGFLVLLSCVKSRRTHASLRPSACFAALSPCSSRVFRSAVSLLFSFSCVSQRSGQTSASRRTSRLSRPLKSRRFVRRGRTHAPTATASASSAAPCGNDDSGRDAAVGRAASSAPKRVAGGVRDHRSERVGGGAAAWTPHPRAPGQ